MGWYGREKEASLRKAGVVPPSDRIWKQLGKPVRFSGEKASLGRSRVSGKVFPFHVGQASARMRAVKFPALLLAAFALSFVACNNLTTRRELYSPGKGKGTYSQQLRSGQYALGVKPQPHAVPTPVPDILAQ
jgi:hypothetical protein